MSRAFRILEPVEEHPASNKPRYIIAGIVVAVAIFWVVWYPLGLRFYKERGTVRVFMDEVVTGNFEGAYRTWKPSPTYPFTDFLADWGPSSPYGQIRSYKIGASHGVRGGASAEIVIALSQYEPFPSSAQQAKLSQAHKLALWVDPKDQSISFPLCGAGPYARPCA
jgi:hypothetical protein